MSDLVTVFDDKFVRSAPALDPEKPWRERDRGRVLCLRDALAADYPTDAHFTAYASPNDCRLNSESLPEFAARGGIPITCGVFDSDGPTHGTGEPAPEWWRKEQREKMVALAQEFPGVYYYETKGGIRFLWRLE
jgi:hypothetical protein